MMKKINNILPISADKKTKVINKSFDIVKTVFRLLILSAIGYIILFPLLQMIVTSIKSKAAFFDASRVWLPSDMAIDFNYKMALDAIDYWNGLKSTLVLQMVSALISVLTCAIAAYGFARFNFKFKNLFMVGLFFTILIPETMIIIPRVVNYSNLDFLGILGLLDSLTGVDLRPNITNSEWAFWLPSLFSMGLRSGLLIFIYIQFFKSLPVELEEAAWIDGANPITTFFRIALPSSGVVITTVLVFSIVWHWNDSFLASMYMQKDFPLSVNLSRIITTLNSFGFFRSQNVETQAIIMASCVLFVVPPLVLYMIMQRKFIESIDRVGITG